MRVLLKLIFFLVILAVIVGGGAWFWAGRMPGPTLDLKQPEKFVGVGTTLELRAESPDGREVSAGVYFVRLRTDAATWTRPVVRVR